MTSRRTDRLAPPAQAVPLAAYLPDCATVSARARAALAISQLPGYGRKRCSRNAARGRDVLRKPSAYCIRNVIFGARLTVVYAG